MKRYKHLWEKITTMRNFKRAYKNAIRGKRHYSEVIEIEKFGVNKYLHKLLDEVKNKTYKISDYVIFHRFTGGKDREIYKLPMRDRIVQHAVMIIVEPIFRETFILDTFSSIKHRGIHLGLSRVKKALRTGMYKYYLKLDVHKCYPSLDKEILKYKLRKKFKDANLMWLFKKIIDSCDHGVPIGNYTSQYFNNYYFNEFDHWIKEQKRLSAYFRYCDDMIILANTKLQLHALFKSINDKVKLLNVRLKDNYLIYAIENRGIDFLGYITYPHSIRIRKRTKNNFINKVTKMNKSSLSHRDENVLASYWGIFIHADCRNLWQKYTGHKCLFNKNSVI